ncbi:hypothetical protein BJY04DRAFT_186240 [Aspergillus karnatakaensis]|uniref:uncharacterized protein n=1 Tax=Aspergillus karnatakaensis TaxID=1810916 RepID=UPI003CCDBFFD
MRRYLHQVGEAMRGGFVQMQLLLGLALNPVEVSMSGLVWSGVVDWFRPEATLTSGNK